MFNCSQCIRIEKIGSDFLKIEGEGYMLNEVNLVGRISNVPRISRAKANVSAVITCNVANQRSENYVDFIQCVFFDQEYLEKTKKRYEDFS